MADLKSSMQFHFDTTKGELLEVDTNVSQVYVVIDDNTKTLIDDHKNLYAKVRASESNRVNNLWIDGLLKTQGKDWHGSEAKIKQLTKKKKGIENVEIECAQRMGKQQWDDASQKRTIIDTFFNYKDRENVLPEYRSCKLWQEMLYINEGSSKGTMEIRTELFKQAKELKKKGKFEKVIHNRLL